MTRKEANNRSERVRRMPCLACRKGGRFDVCGRTEEHHLNFDGKAGQKRRGNDFTIPLGEWHHQGIPKRGWTSARMEAAYGPSLKLSSKAFRRTYGSDDELLAQTDRELGL